jgi:D-glucosaminate-6-phosphate ammonia-lyase
VTGGTPSPGVRGRLGLRPIVNASGTMTGLGSSAAPPEVAAAVAGVLGEFVEIADLQRACGRTIARLTGAEAGFATASAAAGITLSVAGAMTGPDPGLIERLPDASGMRHEVVVQAGHMVAYGAPLEQGIRLAGARVVPVGQATSAHPYQLEAAIGPATAAAVYVVSHHCVHYGQVPLPEFAAACRRRGVPVIVDAASEYDLRGFLAAGADVAVYSAHKFLGGPTAGIVAGRKDLVRAAYLQNRGIGRGMKVGKEGIAGTIAALEAWERRDHAAVRAAERARLDLWLAHLSGRPGVDVRIVPDPTGNPLERLRLAVDPVVARVTAWRLADRLAAGDPPVIVRDHEVEHGFFQLDPCTLGPGEAEVVAERIAAELDDALARGDPSDETPAERSARRLRAALAWPD